MRTTRLALLALAGAALLLSACDECSRDGDCADGAFCTGEEVCQGGICLAGTPPDCDDGLTCTDDSCDEDSDQCLNEAVDRDGDGSLAVDCGGDDCDDGDAAVNPEAAELCNGVDDDCNGVVEEDKDGDGYFDVSVCAEGDDCDDKLASVNPGAVEDCDSFDDNCSGGIDDEEDTDEDGSIDPTCGGDDCDDEDPSVSPDAVEVCDGVDNDCDGQVDEGFECSPGEEVLCVTICGTLGRATCTTGCLPPTDPDSCRPPDEVCNGFDDDCDGWVDEGFDCVPDALTECVTVCGSIGGGPCSPNCELPPPPLCEPPYEVCNGADDDCDGLIDEGFPCTPGELVSCMTVCGTQGHGHCTNDCTFPTGYGCIPPPENCSDGIDDNCNGLVDCDDPACIGTPICTIR